MSYRPTIGLEIHAELRTKTKMFCNSANDPDEARPNVNICPICLAHPGTLPVINKEAVRHILRVGSAIGGTLADETEFDRKSYFYPDIPKGYQISQYERPLVQGGELEGVKITRVHLEEDTARSTHLSAQAGAGGISLVDFNRAGMPLMELVTEPVIESAEQAGAFARELQLLLRTLRASEANLEKGEMRIEANVSVSKEEGKLGTKVEIKNLNSFRSVERAIAHEITRQTELIEKGGTVLQETRGWDEAKQETFHQRFKEGSADYRYFPEPDLPKLYLSEAPEFSPEAIKETLPELPWNRRSRYARDYALKPADIAFLSESAQRSEFFDAVALALSHEAEDVQLAANYIVTDLAGIFAKKGSDAYDSIDPIAFAKLIGLVRAATLSSRGAKEVLAVLVEEKGDPELIASERGLMQIHDTEALGRIVDAVIGNEEKAVGEYKAGKETALMYLVGKAMKESKGAGNPTALREVFIAKLS